MAVEHQDNISDTPQEPEEESRLPSDIPVEHFHRNYRIIRELLQCQYFLNEGAKDGYSKQDLNQNKIRENIKTHKVEIEELLGIDIKLKAATDILFNQILRGIGAEIVKVGARYQITNPEQLL